MNSLGIFLFSLLRQNTLGTRGTDVMTGLTSGTVRQQQKAKMADSGDSSAAERNNSASETADERLKRIYSMVNEKETPLPRSWSPKDKYNFIGLSQNNLRVHYKGWLRQ